MVSINVSLMTILSVYVVQLFVVNVGFPPYGSAIMFCCFFLLRVSESQNNARKGIEYDNNL